MCLKAQCIIRIFLGIRRSCSSPYAIITRMSPGLTCHQLEIGSQKSNDSSLPDASRQPPENPPAPCFWGFPWNSQRYKQVHPYTGYNHPGLSPPCMAWLRAGRNSNLSSANPSWRVWKPCYFNLLFTARAHRAGLATGLGDSDCDNLVISSPNTTAAIASSPPAWLSPPLGQLTNHLGSRNLFLGNNQMHSQS